MNIFICLCGFLALAPFPKAPTRIKKTILKNTERKTVVSHEKTWQILLNMAY